MATVINKKITFWTILKVSFCVAVCVTMLYPFIYMLAVTFSDNLSVMRNEITIYPKGFNLNAYKQIFKDERIFRSYKNTLIYVSIGTVISLFLTSMSAFVLAQRDKLIFSGFIIAVFMVPYFFAGGMIPTFLTIKSYGMLNTIWAVILPSAVWVYYVVIMRTFFVNYSKEIMESGELDGLNDFGVFIRLVLPTSKAALTTIGLFYVVAKWNEFMGPFLYLSDPKKFPLQIILREIILQGSMNDAQTVRSTQDITVIEESLKYAAIIISIVPIIAAYPFIQKYFVKGIMIGSLKG